MFCPVIFVPAVKACCTNALDGFTANAGWLIEGAGADCIKLPDCFYSIGLFPNELLDNVDLLSKLRFPNRPLGAVSCFAAILKSIFPGTAWLIVALLFAYGNDPVRLALGRSSWFPIGNYDAALGYENGLDAVAVYKESIIITLD